MTTDGTEKRDVIEKSATLKGRLTGAVSFLFDMEIRIEKCYSRKYV
jgi:hypothetical protein